ncbi:MAG: hypothetical protein VYC17_01705 [Nitrospinota bacterium]|nr:hypothetical protein [Nitrospinota bacterium]
MSVARLENRCIRPGEKVFYFMVTFPDFPFDIFEALVVAKIGVWLGVRGHFIVVLG